MKKTKKDIFDIELEPYEQEIEDNIDKWEVLEGEEHEKMLKRMQEGAAAHLNKDKTISLRLTTRDVYALKKRADEEGMPYQTLITSVLRKYVSDDFIEKKQLQQVLHMQEALRAEKPAPQRKAAHKPVKQHVAKHADKNYRKAA